MRKKLIVGNWKMNLAPEEGARFVADLSAGSGDWPGVDVVVCPPFVTIPAVAAVLAGTRIELGAQNMHDQDSGAFTGEVSGHMLLTVGCKWVILGHSERRQWFGESDVGVNKKLVKALALGLRPIVCVGETLDERETGQTIAIIQRQLLNGLANIARQEIEKVTIAYEPVWAIGTGKVATLAQAADVHSFIRSWVGKTYDRQPARHTTMAGGAAEHIRILYGGSVKPENAREMLSNPELDGALVGGASLQVEAFDGIIRAAG